MAKFKPGDRVRTKYQLSVRYPKGYEDVVTALKSQHGINFVSLGDDPGGWFEEHFELVQSAKPEPVADEPKRPTFRECLAIAREVAPAAEQPKEDPYNPHGLSEQQRLHDERHIAGQQHDSDDRHGRRAKLLAALAAEHPRPAQPRFPSVGRDCRVYGRNRR